MPVWAFIEVISFGDFLRFIEFVSQKIGWELPADIKSLDRVRQIRNAAAHNNCILNDLRPTYDENGKLKWSEPLYITSFMKSAGISKNTMQKKLSNRRFSQIVHLLYVYNKVVISANSRKLRTEELKELIQNRMTQNQEYFASNQLLVSTFTVFEKIVDYIS